MTTPSLDALVAMMPFAAAIGLRLTAASAAEVIGTMDWAAERANADGGLHGGALMAMADSVGALCAYLNLPPGASTSTTGSSTVFLRGVRGGTVTATAVALHVGRSTIVVRTDLCGSDGRLVAQVTQTQAVLTA